MNKQKNYADMSSKSLSTKESVRVARTRRHILFSNTITFSQYFIIYRIADASFFGGISEEEYQNETYSLANLAKEVSTMPKNADGKEQKVVSLKTEINRWVAKYRREAKFGGRPSYTNMYSAVNALSGHLNTFGPTDPVPKKRLERVLYELDQTSLFLSKGR